MCNKECYLIHYSSEYGVFKWLQKHAIRRFPPLLNAEDIVSGGDVWKERKDAEVSLKTYLSDIPSKLFPFSSILELYKMAQALSHFSTGRKAAAKIV